MQPPAELPATDDRPVPENVLAMARQAVLDFHECFWFRHPNATIGDWEDIRLIVERLRAYGGSRAWQQAQRLHTCH